MRFCSHTLVRFSLYTLAVVSILLCSTYLVLTSRYSTDDSVPPRSPDAIRVVTYNVHYIAARKATGAWSLADWEQRKEPMRTAITALEADIIGFQEMETFGGTKVTDTNLTLEWLLETHPQYSAGAVGNPVEFPSTQPIFYRTDRFTLEDQGWFFFSLTPDTIYSRTFNGHYPAFASWVQLVDTTTNITFRVLNLHTDFQSFENRMLSLQLVSQRVQPWLENNEAVIVLGDFNAWRGSRVHEYLETIGLTFAPVSGATYHFDRGINLFPAIDHIAYSDSFRLTQKPVVVQQKFESAWPTDHYPVVADFSLTQN